MTSELRYNTPYPPSPPSQLTNYGRIYAVTGKEVKTKYLVDT